MALHTDVSEIKNYEDLCYVEDGKNEDGETLFRFAPVTEALFFHMMVTSTGGSITDKNYRLVFERIWIWEQIQGPMLMGANGESRPITLKDVKDHIGLKTNAYENGKRAFKERVCTTLFDRSRRVSAKQEKELETAVEQLGEAVDDAA